MKITFLYGNMQRGGAQRVICCLANDFVRRGDQVGILTLDDGESEYELDAGIKVTGLAVAGDSANRWESIRRFLNTERKIGRWLAAEKPDAVLAFSTKLAMQLWLAMLFGGKKCRVICSERANPQFVEEKKAEAWLEQKALAHVDGFIFQTERVKALFPERLQKIGAVIHNGLFSEDIPEAVTAFADRDQKAICAVGRLENEQKAYDVMLEAFALFREMHPGYALHIYGSGGSEAEIQTQVGALGLAGSVILHGNHPHVIHEIKNMGMFVMTSRYEGMPNALIEAMACGLPCICTDCDFGPAELIRNGENGLLVPVEDAPAVAAAMGRIADDPALAEKLSQGAQAIRHTHARKLISEQYRDYINSVIEKQG